jgi:probable rRNA maturation factor
MPDLELFDHQSSLPLDLARLLTAGREALPLVLQSPGPHEPVLPALETVEISFLTDEAIAAVHGEFMDDPTPTDVITFHHGEILISAETAIRQAPEGAHSPERECALYLIHGLLHLNGHHDSDPAERAAMHARQEAILAAVWPAGIQA